MTDEYEYEYRKDKFLVGPNGERLGPVTRKVYKDPLVQEVWNWYRKQLNIANGVPVYKMPAGWKIQYEDNV